MPIDFDYHKVELNWGGQPLTLETGKIINVPLFIKEGELVKVSTSDGTYMGRA